MTQTVAKRSEALKETALPLSPFQSLYYSMYFAIEPIPLEI